MRRGMPLHSIFFLLAACFFSFGSVPLFAVDAVSIDERTTNLDLLKSSEYFEDKTAQLLFMEIRQKPDLTWKSLDRGSLGFTNSAIWMRVQLSHQLSYKKTWIINFDYPHIDRIDSWIIRGNQITQKNITGDSAFIKQWGLSMPLELDSQETVDVYFRVKTESNMQVTAAIHDPIHFGQSLGVKSKWYFLYYGMVLVMVIYNAFLYQFVRDQAYLFYVLYIGSYLLFTMSLTGDFQQTFSSNTIVFSKSVIPFFQGWSAFWFMQFSQRFLKLDTYSRKITLYTSVIKYLGLGTVFLAFLVPYKLAAYMGISLGALASLLPFFAISCYRKGYLPARYFILAFGAVLCGIVILILQKYSIWPTNFFTSNAIYIGSALEIILLAHALGDKIHHEQMESRRANNELHRNLEAKHAQVIALNENLEERVDAQTHEIRSLLDYIPQGVFSIEENLTVSRQFSAHLPHLLGTTEINGRNFNELILDRSTLTSEEKDRIVQTLHSAIGDDELAFSVNSANLPGEILFVDWHDKEKAFALTWNPDVSPQGTVKRVLVTILDVTQSNALKKEIERQQREMNLVKELIDCGSSRFAQFEGTIVPLLEENERLINLGITDKDTIKIMFVNAHTGKGAARTLGLSALSNTIHEAEAYYSQLIKESIPIDHQRMQNDMKRIRDALSRYVATNRDTLDRKDDSKKVQIDKEFLAEHCKLIYLLENERNLSGQDNLGRTIRQSLDTILNMIYKSLPFIMEDCFRPAARIARDLGKPEPELKMQLVEIPVSQQIEDVLRKVSIHILRNALDHGIESQAERLKAGKPPLGKITLESKVEGNRLHILIGDDGRGLPVKQLREQAIQADPSKATASPAEIARTIFESGVSTAQSVSQFSGRGIGMNAVKRFIEEAGGEIDILLKDSMDPDGHFYSFEMDIVFPIEATLFKMSDRVSETSAVA
jgi:signal transduction histidine kinase